MLFREKREIREKLDRGLQLLMTMRSESLNRIPTTFDWNNGASGQDEGIDA